MKFRISCFAVLFAAGIVFITGCGKGASAPADKKESAAIDRNTPVEVARRFVEALWKPEPDTAAAISLSDGEMKEIIKRMGEKVAQIKKTAANGDEKAKEILDEGYKAFRETQFVFKGEKIDGELATVDVVMIRNKKNEVEKAFLRKVNGKWRVISANDYRIANGGRSPADVDVAKKWHEETFRNGDAAKALEFVSGDSMKKETEEVLKKVKAVDCSSSGDGKVDSDTNKVKVTYKDRDGNRKETVDYELEKEKGEWKISKPVKK